MSSQPPLSGMPSTAAASLPYVSAAQATTLLRSGLAIASELMGSALPAVVRAVLDDLDSRWDLDAEGHFVRRLLHDRDSELRSSMLMSLRARQDEALKDLFKRVETVKQASVTADDLSLQEAVNDVAKTVVTRHASRMHGVVEEPFRDLHLIVRHLCGRSNLRPGEDPFAPEIFLRALLDAAADLSLAETGWDFFASLCERPLADELVLIHRALLDHFQRHGLEASAVRREITARQQAERAAAKQQAEMLMAQTQARLQRAVQGGETGADGTTVPYNGMPGFDLGMPGGFAGQFPPGMPGMPGVPGSPGYAAYPGAGGRGGPRIDVPQAPPAFVLGQLLSRMQASVTGMPVPGGFAASSPPEEALLTAVGELQQLGVEGLAGASIAEPQAGAPSAWREHLVQKSSRTVDKLTIELVGLMFDHVLQDLQVPDEIKTLLSRLQFPVLKAALLDADFFTSNSHPARRLIDRIATASSGWEPYGDENERFLSEVERVVKAVLEGFGKDLGIFEKLLGEFNAFVGEISPRDSDPLARAKRALEEAEKREILVINTTIQVRRAFEKVELDPVLRDFLVGPWVQTLVEATLRDAATPGFSKRFREVIHDLVWSVQPKANNEDRRRLTTLIPNLLRTLRDGMALTRTSEHEQQEFLRYLMQAHAVAVKPVDQATYIRSSLVSSDVRAKVEGIQITGTHPITSVAGGFRVSAGAVLRAAEEFDAELHVAGPVTDIADLDRVEEAEMDEQISSWQRGTWFEMYDGKERIKVRLRWISPLRTLFLFSANQEKDAHVLPPDVIKSYLKRGYLKALESAPLTKRAVDQVVGDFEKSPKFAQELAARFAPAG